MVGVIGDIHGCYYTLRDLAAAVRDKYENIDIYCVGDIVDRGLHSLPVVSYCITNNIKVTLGNHDCMFLYAFKYPKHPYFGSWILNGNYETINSYSWEQEKLREHLNFIDSFPLFYNLEDCFISHAGVSINYGNVLKDCVNWDNDKWTRFFANDINDDIFWNRSKLFNIGKLQVVGHTKYEEVTFDKKSNGLYIDTGACGSNKLSCVIIEKGKWIDTLSSKTNILDLCQVEF